MECIKLTERVWVLLGGVNCGLVAGEAGLFAVDTGLDRSAANRLVRAAEALGRPLVGVLNTHAHADHHGGNAQLVRRLGVPVFAPAVEEAVIREPRYEPIYLYGGAAPVPALQNRFLQAEPSPVDRVLAPGETVSLEGTEVEVVDLRGHSIAQVGYLVDGVLFAADAFFGTGAMGKHGIPYLVDAGAARDTLERLRATEHDWYVPGHGEALRDPAVALDANVAVIDRTLAWLADRISAAPATTDDLLAELVRAFGLAVGDPTGFVLFRTTLLGYLTTLERRGAARVVIEGGRWLWSG